jgi:hypothetical protein
MSDPIKFSRVIQGELPFTLNLPSGSYGVNVDGCTYHLEILQGRVTIAIDAKSWIIGTPEELQARFGDRWDSIHKHELRTVVRHDDAFSLTREELPTPDNEQLRDAAIRKMLENNPGYVSGPDGLQADAQRALAELNAEDHASFVTDTTIRLASRRGFPPKDVEVFCQAVNLLIRLYMANFNDFFVQEITESHFSGTAFHGIHVSTYCNDQSLETARHVGGRFPHMIRRPWLEHPQAEVDRFTASLETTPDPDPVVLLNVRARSLLMRGGYRSALLEASAAFDLCLVRKIRSGYAAKGKSDAEIDTILDANRHLDDKAKKVLKDAVGKSGAELEPQLWQRFITHRQQRGRVAHTFVEPKLSEATEAVEDMIRLAALIEAI